MGSDLDEGRKQVFATHLYADQLLTVHAIHQAHHDGMLPYDGLDTLHCAGQRTVFQRDFEEIHPGSFLRRPDFRAVGFAVDGAAVPLEAFGPLTFCDHAQSDALFFGKAPDDVGADGTRTQYRDGLDLHLYFHSLCF